VNPLEWAGQGENPLYVGTPFGEQRVERSVGAIKSNRVNTRDMARLGQSQLQCSSDSGVALLCLVAGIGKSTGDDLDLERSTEGVFW
jgi:hypothetical protein